MPGHRFLINGQVQGVGYRHFAARAARSVGLAGTVRNLADGSVEVLAWGAPDRLARLADLLLKGPRFSNVTNVEILEIPPDISEPVGFYIIG